MSGPDLRFRSPLGAESPPGRPGGPLGLLALLGPDGVPAVGFRLGRGRTVERELGSDSRPGGPGSPRPPLDGVSGRWPITVGGAAEICTSRFGITPDPCSAFLAPAASSPALA